MTKAYEIGGPSAQSAIITPIFRAYYEDDLDISDPEVLADAAVQATIMSKAEVSISPAVCRRSWKIVQYESSGGDPAFEIDLEAFRLLS
jgi:hypothetical protein